MSYQTGVVEALRDHQLDVRLVPGCERRGSAVFTPRGHVWHHDAIVARYTSPPRLLIDGRSDLAGPLCNFNLLSTGTIYVVALGRANHAGLGGWMGLVGNTSVWGTEAQNSGTGQVWPDEQIDAYVRLDHALGEFSGFDARFGCRHAEWTSRKIDPWGPWASGRRWETPGTSAHFRHLSATNQGAAPDMDETQSRKLDEIHQAITGQEKLPFGLRKVIAAAQQGATYLVKIEGQRGQWMTDLRVRWQLNKFTRIARDRFAVPLLELDAEDGALFLENVPERDPAPAG